MWVLLIGASVNAGVSVSHLGRDRRIAILSLSLVLGSSIVAKGNGPHGAGAGSVIAYLLWLCWPFPQLFRRFCGDFTDASAPPAPEGPEPSQEAAPAKDSP